jgi:hypothetical protein
LEQRGSGLLKALSGSRGAAHPTLNRNSRWAPS